MLFRQKRAETLEDKIFLLRWGINFTRCFGGVRKLSSGSGVPTAGRTVLTRTSFQELKENMKQLKIDNFFFGASEDFDPLFFRERAQQGQQGLQRPAQLSWS